MSGYTTAMMAVTTALSTVASISSSEAQKSQAEYQSDMAAYNAQVAEGNAQRAEEEGRQIKQTAYEQSLEKRQEAAKIVSRQRAQQAGSGVVTDVGSALDLNLDTVEKGELDAFAIKEKGAWDAYNKQVEAWNFRSQGQTQQAASQMYANKASSSSALLPAAGTLLSGATKVGNNYMKLSKSIT